MRNGNKIIVLLDWLASQKVKKKALLFLTWFPIVMISAIILKIINLIPGILPELFMVPVLFLPFMWMLVLSVSCVADRKLRWRLFLLGAVFLVITMSMLQVVLIVRQLYLVE